MRPATSTSVRPGQSGSTVSRGSITGLVTAMMLPKVAVPTELDVGPGAGRAGAMEQVAPRMRVGLGPRRPSSDQRASPGPSCSSSRRLPDDASSAPGRRSCRRPRARALRRLAGTAAPSGDGSSMSPRAIRCSSSGSRGSSSGMYGEACASEPGRGRARRPEAAARRRGLSWCVHRGKSKR